MFYQELGSTDNTEESKEIRWGLETLNYSVHLRQYVVILWRVNMVVEPQVCSFSEYLCHRLLSLVYNFFYTTTLWKVYKVGYLNIQMLVCSISLHPAFRWWAQHPKAGWNKQHTAFNSRCLLLRLFMENFEHRKIFLRQRKKNWK